MLVPTLTVAENVVLGREPVRAGTFDRARAVREVEALCELIELPTEGPNAHPWFIGCQFHPEFSSSPRTGHPLFKSFVEAALAYQMRKTSTTQGAQANAVAV